MGLALSTLANVRGTKDAKQVMLILGGSALRLDDASTVITLCCWPAAADAGNAVAGDAAAKKTPPVQRLVYQHLVIAVWDVDVADEDEPRMLWRHCTPIPTPMPTPQAGARVAPTLPANCIVFVVDLIDVACVRRARTLVQHVVAGDGTAKTAKLLVLGCGAGVAGALPVGQLHSELGLQRVKHRWKVLAVERDTTAAERASSTDWLLEGLEWFAGNAIAAKEAPSVETLDVI
jgi:hypothetical protein